MHFKMSRCVLALACTACTLGTLGCGSRQYDVTGKVTYNDAVLDKPDGQISFIGPNGEQAMASIGPDGNYRASKVAAGVNKVVVFYPNPLAKISKKTRRKLDKEEGQSPTQPAFLTPPEYASADTTEFSITVGKGTVFNPSLKGPEIP